MRLHILFFILFFITACANDAVRTTPFNGTTQEQIAQNITLGCGQCAAGEVCKNDKCTCIGKTCEGKCLSANSCCTSAECGNGACVNNKCNSAPICDLNEEFRAGECLCAAGHSRCQEQGKCIKIGSCCFSGNCARGDRCVPTVWRSSVCFEIGEKKTCRLMADNNRTELVTIDAVDYRLKILDWSNNGNITLSAGNLTVQLAKNQSRPFAGHTIFQEGIDEIGGVCKEDED